MTFKYNNVYINGSTIDGLKNDDRIVAINGNFVNNYDKLALEMTIAGNEEFKMTLKNKEGKREEYIRRHNEIWQEMVDLLKSAGIRNYSIWLSGNDIFGYYECEKGIDFATKTQSESPIVDKWNEYMGG